MCICLSHHLRFNHLTLDKNRRVLGLNRFIACSPCMTTSFTRASSLTRAFLRGIHPLYKLHASSLPNLNHKPQSPAINSPQHIKHFFSIKKKKKNFINGGAATDTAGDPAAATVPPGSEGSYCSHCWRILPTSLWLDPCWDRHCTHHSYSIAGHFQPRSCSCGYRSWSHNHGVPGVWWFRCCSYLRLVMDL